MGFIVRTEGDARKALKAVEAQIHAVDRNQPVSDVLTMEERLSSALESQRVQFFMIGAFAAVAVLLASVGIYGLMSFLVVQRTHEIGVRMALGAQRADVMRLVIGRALKLIAIGTAIGLLMALFSTRALQALLYRVSAIDLPTFFFVTFVLALVALAASFLPAQRATRADPMVALNHNP